MSSTTVRSYIYFFCALYSLFFTPLQAMVGWPDELCIGKEKKPTRMQQSLSNVCTLPNNTIGAAIAIDSCIIAHTVYLAFSVNTYCSVSDNAQLQITKFIPGTPMACETVLTLSDFPLTTSISAIHAFSMNNAQYFLVAGTTTQSASRPFLAIYLFEPGSESIKPALTCVGGPFTTPCRRTITSAMPFFLGSTCYIAAYGINTRSSSPYLQVLYYTAGTPGSIVAIAESTENLPASGIAKALAVSVSKTFPTPGVAEAPAASSSNGEAYLGVTGTESGTTMAPYMHVYRFDPATGTISWSASAPVGTNGLLMTYCPCTVNTIDSGANMFFVTTGCDGMGQAMQKPFLQIYAYTEGSSALTKVVEAPYSADGLPTSGMLCTSRLLDVHGNQQIVVGGTNSKTSLTQVYIFDPLQGTLSKNAEIICPLTYLIGGLMPYTDGSSYYIARATSLIIGSAPRMDIFTYDPFSSTPALLPTQSCSYVTQASIGTINSLPAKGHVFGLKAFNLGAEYYAIVVGQDMLLNGAFAQLYQCTPGATPFATNITAASAALTAGLAASSTSSTPTPAPVSAPATKAQAASAAPAAATALAVTCFTLNANQYIAIAGNEYVNGYTVPFSVVYNVAVSTLDPLNPVIVTKSFDIPAISLPTEGSAQSISAITVGDQVYCAVAGYDTSCDEKVPFAHIYMFQEDDSGLLGIVGSSQTIPLDYAGLPSTGAINAVSLFNIGAYLCIVVAGQHMVCETIKPFAQIYTFDPSTPAVLTPVSCILSLASQGSIYGIDTWVIDGVSYIAFVGFEPGAQRPIGQVFACSIGQNGTIAVTPYGSIPDQPSRGIINAVKAFATSAANFLAITGYDTDAQQPFMSLSQFMSMNSTDQIVLPNPVRSNNLPLSGTGSGLEGLPMVGSREPSSVLYYQLVCGCACPNGSFKSPSLTVTSVNALT